MQKALADFRQSGGLYYPIRLASGGVLWGAERYARLSGNDLQPEGWFEEDVPCLASQEVGTGCVFYLATRAGRGAAKDPAGLLRNGVPTLLRKALDRAGVRPMAGLRGPGLGQVRVDLLSGADGPRFLVMHNRSADEQVIQLDPLPDGEGLFTDTWWHLSDGQPVTVPGGYIDLIVL